MSEPEDRIAMALAFARLRDARALSIVLALAAFAVVLATRTRTDLSVDDVVLGPVGAVAVPLGCFTLVSAILAHDTLVASAVPLAVAGASPRRVVVAYAFVAVLSSALFAASISAAATVVAMVVARGVQVGGAPASVGIVHGGLVSAYVGAVGGAAYGALFVLGSTFGPRGMGRGVALLLDWSMGSAASAFATPLPRAHLRSLFGGAPVGAWTQRASGAYLLVFAVLALALAATVARPARVARAIR